MADVIILSAIGICVFFIIRNMVKKAKNKELGCSCGCSGCSGCASRLKDHNTSNRNNH